jgi:HNH endonuclease
MALSVRTRFEVFKRDGFTCQYCGGRTPDAVLEIDHVIPRVQGGGDELANLVTACWECNRGKAARLLGDRAPTPDDAEQTRLLREREEQLRAYNDLRGEIRARRNEAYAEVLDHWFEVWGETSLHRWHLPWENVLRTAVEKLGPAEVMEAMEITAGRFRYVTANAVRYFGGVLKRKLAIVEGRLVPCTVCGEFLELTAEQAAKRFRWHHSTCETTQGPEREPTEQPSADTEFVLLNHPATAELVHRSIAVFEKSWQANAECAWVGYEREIKPRINTAIADSGLHRDALVRYCTEALSCGCSSCLDARVDDS